MEQELKLSDAFFEKHDKLYVEVFVRVINVNYEKGARLLASCRLLKEYSILIYKIRQHEAESGDLKQAITLSVQGCVREGILEAFLKRNGGDVMSFLYEALSREECEAIREEDGYVRGLEAGRQEGLQIGLESGRKLGKTEGIVIGSFETLEKLIQNNILSLQQAADQMEERGDEFVTWYQENHRDG